MGEVNKRNLNINENDSDNEESIKAVSLNDDVHEISQLPAELASRERSASATMTCLNILKSYMGSGILGLPYAFAQGGLIGSLFLMTLLGVIATHAMYLLVRAKHILIEQDKKVVTYGDVAEACFGKVGLYIVNAMLIFTQFGFCCVYVVFVSTNVTLFVDVPNYVIVLIWLPIFIGLSWIRTLKILSYVSAFSIATITMSTLIILIASFINIYDIIDSASINFDINLWVEWKTIAIMLGMGIYAFEGIGVVLPCESSIKNPSLFNPTLLITLAVASFNYILFGVVPYLSFGRDTCDIITSNLSQFASEQNNEDLWRVLSDLVTIGLILAITGTFPLQLFVVTDICEEWIFRPGRISNNYRMWKENAFRTALVVLASIIAILIPNFGTLIGLIGSIGSSSLQFIFPALFMLKINNGSNLFFKILMVSYVVFGFAAGILGTVQTILQIIHGDSSSC